MRVAANENGAPVKDAHSGSIEIAATPIEVPAAEIEIRATLNGISQAATEGPGRATSFEARPFERAADAIELTPDPFDCRAA